MFRRGMLWISVIAMVCALPTSAAADSLKIGTSLQRPQDIYAFCASEGCVGVQRAVATGSEFLPLTSPVGGRVTSWSVRSNDDGALYALRILKPLGGFAYAGRGTAFASSTVTSGPDAILTFPTSLRARGRLRRLPSGARLRPQALLHWRWGPTPSAN